MYSTGIVAVGHPWLSRHGHGHGQLLKTDLIHCFLQPFKLHIPTTTPLHFRVSHLHHCRRPCRYGRLLLSPTMQLQDSSVKMEVDVPASLAYQCYNDRESIPQWMPFISTVKVLQDKPDLSRWTLKYTAFGRDIEFSWLARNLQPIPNKKIHWRSLEGLPNSGAVRFFPKGPSSCLIERQRTQLSQGDLLNLKQNKWDIFKPPLTLPCMRHWIMSFLLFAVVIS